MSTRTNLRPQVVISAASMAGNLTSTPTVLQGLSLVSYAISWAASTAVGSISVQVSNDYALASDGAGANAGTWSSMTFQYSGALVSQVPVTGASGNGFVDITKTAAYACRLIYTATSGTGTLTATISGKVS